MSSAPDAITSERIARLRGGSARLRNEAGAPFRTPRRRPRPKLCGSRWQFHLLEASPEVSSSAMPADMGWRPHFSGPAPFRFMKRPLMIRRDDSLIGQVVAANVVLVAITLFAASLAAGLDLTVSDQRWSFLILALSIVLTLCVNLWMLQRRFAPLERLIRRIEGIDPAEPSSHQLPDQDPVEEIDKLSRSFNGLLRRIEEERRRSGTLAMRAQEEERRRLARDL